MSTRSLNKVMLIGNLTRDPNMRYTPTGSAVCSFSIATNRTWTPSDGGEKQEKADFHNIVAWTKLAELCGSLLHKGDKVYVEGRLQMNEWKNKEGVDQKTPEIVITDMLLLNSRSGAPAGQSYGDSNFSSDDASSKSAASTAKTTKKTNKVEKSEEVPSDDVTDVQDISDDIDIPF